MRDGATPTKLKFFASCKWVFLYVFSSQRCSCLAAANLDLKRRALATYVAELLNDACEALRARSHINGREEEAAAACGGPGLGWEDPAVAMRVSESVSRCTLSAGCAVQCSCSAAEGGERARGLLPETPKRQRVVGDKFDKIRD